MTARLCLASLALFMLMSILSPYPTSAATLTSRQARDLVEEIRELARARAYERAWRRLKTVDALSDGKPTAYQSLINTARTLHRKQSNPEALRWALRMVDTAEATTRGSYRALRRNLNRDLKKAGLTPAPVVPPTAPETGAPPPETATTEPDPKQADALAVRAVALMDQGKHAEALLLLRQAVALWPPPGDHRVLCDLGSTLLVLGEANLPEAERRLRRSIELEAGFPKAHLNLGVVLARTGRLDEALESFRRAERLDGQDPSVFYNQAYAYKQKYQQDPQRSFLTRALPLARKAVRISDQPKHRRLVDWLRAEQRRLRQR